jgi:two-component system response regulator YesN
VTELEQFSVSYEEALLALEFVYSMNKGNYLIYHEGLKERREQLLPFDQEKKLLESIKNSDVQSSLRLFDQYFYTVAEASHQNVNHVKISLRDLFIVISRMVKEIGIDLELQQEFKSLNTMIQVKEYAKNQLVLFINTIKEWRMNDAKGLLYQAKEYIDTNYHKVVTLDETADYIGLSPYYFSKMFKERFQMTFIDYLTQLRIAKAKELLNDQKMSLKEIASTIGYRDPNYFSRVYKKATGESPSDYRTRHFKAKLS